MRDNIETMWDVENEDTENLSFEFSDELEGGENSFGLEDASFLMNFSYEEQELALEGESKHKHKYHVSGIVSIYDKLCKLRNKLWHLSRLNLRPSSFAFLFSFSLSDVLFVSLYLLFNFLYLYSHNFFMIFGNFTELQLASNPLHLNIPQLKSVANSCGKLAQVNIALGFVFMTRNSLWNFFVGSSFENSVKFHRWIFSFIPFLLFFHFGLFQYAWLYGKRNNPTPGEMNWQRWSEKILELPQIWGILAVLIYLLIAFTSFFLVRRKLFELFRTVHLIFVPFFLLFVLLHHHGLAFIPMIIGPFILYLLDLLIRALSNFCAITPTTLFQKFNFNSLRKLLFFPGKDTIILDITTYPSLVELTIYKPNFSYKAGQYVYLMIPVKKNGKMENV